METGKKARETKARIEVIGFGHLLFELSFLTLLDISFFGEMETIKIQLEARNSVYHEKTKPQNPE